MKTRFLLVWVLVGFALPGPAFAHGAPTSPAGRTRYLMDRAWKFHLGDTTAADQPGFDDAAWRALDLPHDWSIEGPFSKDAPAGGRGGYLPTGIGWYRKSFNLPALAKGKIVKIAFDGVHMNSEVWINGHSLGKRPNGYISFVYDLTPYLKSGKNVLSVRVDNSIQPNSRWYSGSGIYRHVWMEITSPLHIGTWGTYVTTPSVDSNQATVMVRTTVDNQGNGHQEAELITTIKDRDGRKVGETTRHFALGAGAIDSLTDNLEIGNPELWSLEHPNIYTITSTIQVNGKTVDSYETPFGVRHIEYSATQGFLLNGQRVKMNGVCLHHDGGCVGAAVPIKIWEERLKLLKEMGCNAIRTSHNPPAPEFLDLCDRMGLLVMDEAFDAWETGKVKYDYSIYFDQWWQRDLTDQIHRDRNHPSVVLWSAGNEVPDQTKERGVVLLNALQGVFHHEDPTRPVTTANDDIAADNGATLEAFLEAADIVGYNYVDRWHERRELFYDADRYQHPTWKVIGTESGSVREPPIYSLGKDSTKARPNYTSGMIGAEQLWKFIAVRPFVIGDFMWTGVDYLGEAFWPSKGAYSGVIDRSNRRKDSYYFYQSQWVSEPVLHLLPHWNWAGREGQVIPVLAYTNCDTVELFLNGKSYGVKAQEFPRQGNSGAWNKYERPVVRANTADLHLSWDVAYEPGVLKALGYRNGHLVAVDSIQTAGAPASIRVLADTGTLVADGQDVALVHVEVLDANGQIVPDATVSLQFGVEGAAVLRGTDNGNPADDHLFASGVCLSFKGKAFAVVAMTTKGGPITIKVASEGLTTATLKLKSQDVQGGKLQFLP